MQTIMIVEDDPDIRDGVRILLSGEGYRILEAENGPRALSLLTPEVDLVILDIMMPGMSGLRVCEEIRKTSTVPILFLTAKSQESDKLLGLTAGGDDYLAKPFAAEELLARIRREQENTVEMEKNGLGCQVTCRIGDEKAPLMTLKLSVADDLQAKLIREHFLDQPELLYRSVLAVLTGDAGMRRSDTQIVIDLK